MGLKSLFISALVLLAASTIGFFIALGRPAPSAPVSGLPIIAKGTPLAERLRPDVISPVSLQEPVMIQRVTIPQIASPIVDFLGESPLVELPRQLLLAPSQPPSGEEISPAISSPLSSTSTPPLSEEEIFNRLWPASYRDYLQAVERLSVGGDPDAGRDPAPLVPEAERTRDFRTNEDVYRSIKTIIGAAREQGWITDEEFQNFERGVNDVLPKLIEQEREALRRGAASSLILPGQQSFAACTAPDNAMRTILDGLAYVFLLAEPAHAAWVRGSDCYKDDNPLNLVPGFNAASFCCNCGIACVAVKKGVVCFFVPDCGTGGIACSRQLGCLNAVCGSWPNAIWDPTTGICGCG